MAQTPVAPPKVSLQYFAWRVAAVREFVINLVINSLIPLWVYWHATAVPLWGWSGLITVLGPMSYLMPWLTSFFGVFAGVMSRGAGVVLPPLPPHTRWFFPACFLATRRAIVCTAVTWPTVYMLAQSYPEFALPQWLAILGLALGSAIVASPLHATAILSTINLPTSTDSTMPAPSSPQASSDPMASSPPIAVKLGEVQETLLIPLYYRAIETNRPDALIRDPYAQQLLEKLAYDFEKFAPHWNIQMDVVVRTEVFDEIVTLFLQQHPSGTVINLGAGLDARFHRLDNGQVKWFEIDLPDAAELRAHLLPDSERHVTLGADIFSWGWMEKIPSDPQSPVLVLAEGLFCYCTEAQLKELLQRIAGRWPGALLAFQSLCPALVGEEKIVGAVNQTKAKFHWGISSGKQVARWSQNYRFLKEYYLVDRHRPRWQSIGKKLWNPFVRRWYRQVMKITLLRL